MVRLSAFVFHMNIPCDKTFLLVSRTRSSAKVKVKHIGHSFRKNGRCRGISVSQTQLVFLCFSRSVLVLKFKFQFIVFAHVDVIPLTIDNLTIRYIYIYNSKQFTKPMVFRNMTFFEQFLSEIEVNCHGSLLYTGVVFH